MPEETAVERRRRYMREYMRRWRAEHPGYYQSEAERKRRAELAAERKRVGLPWGGQEARDAYVAGLEAQTTIHKWGIPEKLASLEYEWWELLRVIGEMEDARAQHEAGSITTGERKKTIHDLNIELAYGLGFWQALMSSISMQLLELSIYGMALAAEEVIAKVPVKKHIGNIIKDAAGAFGKTALAMDWDLGPDHPPIGQPGVQQFLTPPKK